MRGKVEGVTPQQIADRITPAHAGKSKRQLENLPDLWDHPRVCGEKADWTNSDVVEWGSPPRMRGKDVRQELQHSGRGITLAYAGKSAGRAATPTRCRDHPRACGEKCPPGKFFFMTVGSPPRMRGKGFCTVVVHGNLGITPAHAGKSSSGFTLLYGSRDHPRACGEKVHHRHRQRPYLGSPPRVRGKVPSSI